MKTDNINEKLIIENEHDLQLILETIGDIQKRAADVATIMLKLQGIKNIIDPDEIQFETRSLLASYSIRNCGEWEEREFYIPDHYLFDEDWIIEAKKKIQLEKQKAEERERARQLKELESRKKREYDEYLKLKAKFEGDTK